MDKQPTTTKKPEMAIKKQPKDLAQKLQSMPKVADYFANPGEGVKTFINQQPVRRHDDPYGDGNPSEKVKKDKTQSSKVDAQFGRDIEVSERTLTPAETAEKERLVKKMKPVEKWQKRYGKRGEEVMYATATKMAKEEVELDEAVVDHQRYERSHGKKASGNGTWMFTNKPRGPLADYDDETKVHLYNGKFGDAKKSAIEWAKKHGHHTAYVMEETELDEETYYVIHKKSRTPGEVSSRAGENIAGVTIKDKYDDRKEAEKHAKHIDKQSLFRNVHGSKLGHGVGKWVNGELQEEVDEVDEGNKYNKLLKNMHARKVGATRMRDHGSPELNRIAALKKGRELMKNSYEPEGEELDEARTKKSSTEVKPVNPKDLLVPLASVSTKPHRGHKQYNPRSDFPRVKVFENSYEPEGEELDEDSHKDHFTFLRHLQKANIPIAARPSKEEALQLVHRHGDANRAAEVYVRRYQKIKNAARKVQKEEVEIKEQVLLELGEPMSPAPATSDNPGGGDQNAGPQAGDGGSSSDRDDDESDDTDDVNDEVKQAKEHLEGIALSSAKLFEDIPDDADIPNWILEKLALSEKFLKSVEKEIGDMSDGKDTSEDDEDEGEGDNDEEPSPKQKPIAFGGGKAAMAKESVDLSEAKKKKSPQDKFFDRIKKVSGYDAKEVLSRPAPGEKPAAVKEGVKLGKRARLAQTLANYK